MTRRCNRNGEVYMVSDTGSDFRASYQAEGGSIRDVTVHSHGHGFLTRPQLMIDDPECRCGSYITGFKIIYGGIGLTSTGSITVTGAEGGRGYMATFTTVNGSLADFNVLVRGSGYVQSSTLSWQLRCFNETTVTTDDCNGGENLVFFVGRSTIETGGMDLCLGFAFATAADIQVRFTAPLFYVYLFLLDIGKRVIP